MKEFKPTVTIERATSGDADAIQALYIQLVGNDQHIWPIAWNGAGVSHRSEPPERQRRAV